MQRGASYFSWLADKEQDAGLATLGNDLLSRGMRFACSALVQMLLPAKVLALVALSSCAPDELEFVGSDAGSAEGGGGTGTDGAADANDAQETQEGGDAASDGEAGLGGVQAVAGGLAHTCAITPTGALKCWGENEYGQLGNGSTTDSPVPLEVEGLSSGVTAVSAGVSHTCAIVAGGAIKCWGRNFAGQLGNGSTTDSSEPVDVQGLSSGVVALAAGSSHTCAIAGTGALKCWGYNWRGQLGNGTKTDSSVPLAVLGGLSSGVTAVAAGGGDGHSCAVGGGSLKCWGYNYFGELGNGTTLVQNPGADNSIPAAVLGLEAGVSSVSAGGSHTCSVTSSGVPKCWGKNGDGQLGDGSKIDQSVPVQVQGLAAVSAITTGSTHTCAVSSAGALMCWGHNFLGMLGDGTTTTRTTPADVLGLGSSVTAVAAGGYHTCAIASGALRCWGSNHAGQLGNGSTSDSSAPVAVQGM